jgi:hypothetical protein
MTAVEKANTTGEERHMIRWYAVLEWCPMLCPQFLCISQLHSLWSAAELIYVAFVLRVAAPLRCLRAWKLLRAACPPDPELS